MPLSITIPARDMFDSRTGEFIETKETVLHLEHSLISISKWESKWHKPYLSREDKTREEAIDYIRCMTLNNVSDPNVYLALTAENINEITSYISDPMTATTIKRQNQRPTREIITSELVYYWMTELNIPFDPCQKWHFSRLLTLIEVCSIKKTPPKKMSQNEYLKLQRAANLSNRARFNTRG